MNENADVYVPTVERTSDGWLFDTETGEVVGRDDVRDQFRIDSEEGANWALELRTRIEAEIIAIDARLETLTANLVSLRREQERRLAWWDWRFGSDLIGWARRQLGSGKTRTLRLDWGFVRARKTPESHQINDHDAALKFVQEWAPGLVKVVRSVGVKDVLESRKQIEEASGDEVILPFLDTKPAGEKWTVGTGLVLSRPKEGAKYVDGSE